MMTYEESERAQDNSSKFINQLQPKTKTLVSKLERILIKLYRQHVSLLFNEICLNEGLLSNYTHTFLSLSLSLYIYIYMYVHKHLSTYIQKYLYIHIYVYTYTHKF